MSGVNLATCTAGAGAGLAAMSGIAVIPVVGWIIASFGIAGIAAKVAIDNTVNRAA